MQWLPYINQLTEFESVQKSALFHELLTGKFIMVYKLENYSTESLNTVPVSLSEAS